MRIIKPNDINTYTKNRLPLISPRDIQGYKDIYGESEKDSGFVQITSIQMIEPYVSLDEDNNNDMRRFFP
jgi:hypothetical protein